MKTLKWVIPFKKKKAMKQKLKDLVSELMRMKKK